MNQALILYPMLTLVGWTFVVLNLMGIRRIVAVRAGRVHVREFALGETAAVAPDVAVVNRNYMNLLELPVLFYAVCLTYYVTRQVDAAALALAWAYAALRIVHSLIHLTPHRVFHRLSTFAVSNVVLLFLWGWLLYRLA